MADSIHAGRSMQCMVISKSVYGIGRSNRAPFEGERLLPARELATMSSCGNLLTANSAYSVGIRKFTALEFRSRFDCVRQIRSDLGLAATTSGRVSPLRLENQQSIGRGRFFRSIAISQTPRRLCGFELHAARAEIKKTSKKDDNDFEISLRNGVEDNLAQLAVSLPLGLASFEGLILVGWVTSLRGLLPGARGFFAAADLILCGIMFANCVVGWYALEHSRSGIEKLPRRKITGKLKAVGPGLLDMTSSLALSFIPLANFFLWFRFASKQRHLPVKTRAAVVANAFIYEGPRFFALFLLLSGGLRVFLQVGLVSNVALLFGALHRPFEEARIKNEKVLMEVSGAKKIGGKKGQGQKPKAKEISAEERERIDRLKELEEFDILLAQSSSRSDSVSSGLPKPKEWSVGETMEWLGQQGLARYATTFAENSIDGALLLQLTNNDLRDELKIQSLGDRRKLNLLIRELKEK